MLRVGNFPFVWALCYFSFLSHHTLPRLAIEELYRPPCCSSLCKGLHCSGDKFIPGEVFWTVQSVAAYVGARWINQSLSGPVSGDIHQSVHGSLFSCPLGRDRDTPSPITLAASYISCAERQRKMGKWRVGEMGDTVRGASVQVGETVDGDDLSWRWCRVCLWWEDWWFLWFQRVYGIPDLM